MRMSVAMCAVGVLAMAGIWVVRLRQPQLVSPPAGTGPIPPSAVAPSPSSQETTGSSATVIAASALDAGGPPVLSTLRLLGTWVDKIPPMSWALVEDTQRTKRAFLRPGSRIGPWELTAIDRGWIRFATPQGDETTLELVEGAPAEGTFGGGISEAEMSRMQAAHLSHSMATLQQQVRTTDEVAARASEAVTVVSEQERVVDRQQIIEATEGNPFQLLTQTPVVPHFQGTQSGFRIASVADSPWTRHLGVQAGDVITAINGKPVLDPRKLSDIASDLFTAANVEVTIQRDGQPLTLHYQMDSSTAQALMGQGSP
jgi:hypothetical protein